MNLLDLLEQFDTATSPSVKTRACLNARYKSAGCRRCVETCPVDTITVDAGTPMLDADTCVGCGVCVAACPTNTFSERHSPEDALAKTVSLLDDETLAIVCPRQQPASETRAPVTRIVRHTRCVGALSPDRLLELSSGGRRSIWLDDSTCADCPLGSIQTTIAQHVTTTNTLLRGFDRSPAVYACTENQEDLLPKSVQRATSDGSRPEMSRRGLFGAFGRLAQRASAHTLAEVVPHRNEEPSRRLTPQIPHSRERLFAQLQRLGEPSQDATVESAHVPFAGVEVTAEACSACELCARFCPTGALEFTRDEDRFTLGFRPALCIDCGICTQACPERAIQLTAMLAAGDCVAVQTQALARGRLTECAGCGDATAVRTDTNGAPRCYSCRTTGGPAVPIHDTTGLFADLEKQLSSHRVSSKDVDFHQKGELE